MHSLTVFALGSAQQVMLGKYFEVDEALNLVQTVV